MKNPHDEGRKEGRKEEPDHCVPLCDDDLFPTQFALAIHQRFGEAVCCLHSFSSKKITQYIIWVAIIQKHNSYNTHHICVVKVVLPSLESRWKFVGSVVCTQFYLIKLSIKSGDQGERRAASFGIIIGHQMCNWE